MGDLTCITRRLAPSDFASCAASTPALLHISEPSVGTRIFLYMIGSVQSQHVADFPEESPGPDAVGLQLGGRPFEEPMHRSHLAFDTMGLGIGLARQCL